MIKRTEQARQHLISTLASGLDVPLSIQNVETADRRVRHSAVLILFGALDDVPASAPPSEVSSYLDVLLLRRSNGLRDHAGQIAFPGGGVETGDSDRVATALREAAEETGLIPSGVDVLGTLSEIHIPVSNHLVTPVIGWWRLPSKVAADHSESVEVFRVPVAELLDPANRGTSVLSRDGQTFTGPAYRLGERFGGRILWGFTSMLLTGLFDELGWSQPWDRQRTFGITPENGGA